MLIKSLMTEGIKRTDGVLLGGKGAKGLTIRVVFSSFVLRDQALYNILGIHDSIRTLPFSPRLPLSRAGWAQCSE